MNDRLVVIDLIWFATITGGALLTQNLRRSKRQTCSQTIPSRCWIHPEAPQPGGEVL